MTDCVRKLRQERGASVVFALVIFLIVTIFSWTMVNGALTAAQNASMQREEEQAYLSVTSAARLFCQQFQGDNTGKMLIGKFPSSVYFPEPPQQFKWSVYWNNTDYQIQENENIVRHNPDGTTTVIFIPSEFTPSDTQDLILDIFETMVQGIDCNTATPKKLSIVPNDDSWPENIGAIQVKLTMDTDYYVTVEFSKDTPGSQNLQYYVSVILKCSTMETPLIRGVDSVIVTKKLTWTVKSVERGRSA